MTSTPQKLRTMGTWLASLLPPGWVGQEHPRLPLSARITLRALVCLVLGAFASSAYANSGIGFLLLGQGLMVLALLPVIPVEALVLRITLGISMGRALTLSFIANLVSTLIGAIIAIGVDAGLLFTLGVSGPEPTKWSATFMLVPCIALSWLIEHRSIAKRAKELPTSQVRNATGLANLISSTGLILFVWSSSSGLPTSSSWPPFEEVTYGFLSASPAREAVQEFYEDNGRLPDDARGLDMGTPTANYELTVLPAGRIQVKFIRPNLPEIHHKHIVLTPTVPSGDGFMLEWPCRSPDIEDQRLLIPSCRDRRRHLPRWPGELLRR